MNARTGLLLGVAGLAAVTCGGVICAGGAGLVWMNRAPASSFVGGQSGVVTLRALDLNAEHDAPLLVARLNALGVQAAVRTVERDGAQLSIDGASDVQATVGAVMPQMRVAFWGEAAPGETARTKLLDRCMEPPCDPVLVQSPPALTGRALRSATLGEQDTMPTITFEFTADGALQLEALTQRQVGRHVVLTVDDAIFRSALVQERITGGTLLLTLEPSDRATAESVVAGLGTGALSGRWELIAID